MPYAIPSSHSSSHILSSLFMSLTPGTSPRNSPRMSPRVSPGGNRERNGENANLNASVGYFGLRPSSARANVEDGSESPSTSSVASSSVEDVRDENEKGDVGVFNAEADGDGEGRFDDAMRGLPMLPDDVLVGEKEGRSSICALSARSARSFPDTELLRLTSLRTCTQSMDEIGA